MSHLKTVGYLAASITFCLMVAISPATAQGLFQSLFGFAPPAPPRAQRLPLSPPPPYRQSLTPPPSEWRSKPHEPAANGAPASGAYRTLCVRMCDGYYWPINQSSSRANFHSEAKLCQASCGSEAKLFYHPNSSPDIDAMVDLTGRAYAKLPNAFRYRKALVGGCQCKPAPWAQSELDRHRQYAALEVAVPAKASPGRNLNAGIEVIAGVTAPDVRTTAPIPPLVETVDATSQPDPSEDRSLRAPVAVRQSPGPQAKRERTRAVQATAPIILRTSAKSKARLPSGALGLGAGGLRWPGE